MAPSAASWSPPRAKIQLKLSIQRIRLLAQKKAQMAKTTRREIAGLLEKHKLEAARIKVEGVMGEDTMVDLLEILELYCELSLARFGLLETVREVDPGVSEAVMGIIYASPRTELKELHVLRDMLMSKYGREFSLSVMENTDDCVPTRVSSKLTIAAPAVEHVDAYLHEIAKAYNVDWQPAGYLDPATISTDPNTSPTPIPFLSPNPNASLTVPPPLSPSASLPSTPLKSNPSISPSPYFPLTPPVEPEAASRTVVISTNLPSPTTLPPAIVTTPAPAATTGTESVGSKVKNEQDAFDALTKRFAELKKR